MNTLRCGTHGIKEETCGCTTHYEIRDGQCYTSWSPCGRHQEQPKQLECDIPEWMKAK